jgi:pimeloyl-ACP methyl ester carboxylesterase
VLLLHGWLGSWTLWRETIEILGREFRTYALDFWGFGDSNRGTNVDAFTVDNFVELVREFMDRLGIVKAPLVGHSMGGTVSLNTAIRYPEIAHKVVIIGSPIDGRSLEWWLKASGIGWIAWLVRHSPLLLRLGVKLYSPFIARNGPQIYDILMTGIEQSSIQSFFESIGSLWRTDLRPYVPKLEMPIMGMYGLKDVVVKPNQAQVLDELLPSARVEVFPDSGHFVMLDNPERFHADLRDFLHA